MVKILNLTLESGEISQPTWATEGEFVSPLFNTNFISKFEINVGEDMRHFNPLEDYRIFYHWFSGVKTP